LEWSKRYGEDFVFERCYSMVQTDDGGYALAGSINPWDWSPTPTDVLLVKTDSAGNVQWNKTYGGADSDYAYSIVQTGDGGYALAGSAAWDAWLVKTDAAGNMQWNQTYRGASPDCASSVVQTRDGGYALAGYTHSFGAGGYDFWLVKTDWYGNIEWNQTYGGTSDDQAFSVVQTLDGGYTIAGWTKSFGAGSVDAWLVKTDAAGNMQWNQTYGGAGSDSAYSLVQTDDGGYALAGGGLGATGMRAAWLVKTDSVGNMQWNQMYPQTSTSPRSAARSVVQTLDGGYALGGWFSEYEGAYPHFLLVKTDAAGNMQWNQTYGPVPNGDPRSLVQTLDGGYALAGTYEDSAYNSDLLLVKYKGVDVPPVANFTYTTQPGAYDVTFNASASYDPNGHIEKYDWDFGDGENDTGMIVTHRYMLRAVYVVKLTVTDNETLTGTIKKTVVLLYGNLKAVSIEPIQVVWGADLVLNKTTDFKISFESTFDVIVGPSIKIETLGFNPNAYQFRYRFAPGNYSFVIGSDFVGSPVFLPRTKPEAAFRFTIDPDNWFVETDETDNTFPRTDFARRTVIDTKPLKILFVPVYFTGEDGYPAYPWYYTGFNQTSYVEHAAESCRYLKAIYPVVESEVFCHCKCPNCCHNGGPRPETEAEADATFTSLLQSLSILAGNDYDRVVGLVRNGWFDGIPGWNSTIGFAGQGWGKASVVTIGYWKTTAEVIGHTYNLTHSNDNGTGFYVIGRRSVEAQTFMSTDEIPNPPAQDSYRKPLPSFWIRTEEYQKLLTALKETADPEILLVSGTFWRNGTVELGDWYHYPSGTPDYEVGGVGNYYVTQKDSLGNTLSVLGFNVTFDGAIYGHSFDKLPLAFTVPYASGAKTIQILNATGQVVASKTVSDNSPAVHVISPNGGEILTSDHVQLSWEATDLDGDPLVYNLLISGDGGLIWEPLETGLKQTTFNLTLTGFSGGNQYIVKVIASDGVNTGEDVSDGFFTIASFTINVVTPAQIVPLGGKANYTLSITSYGGFSNPITLNASSTTTDKLAFRWVNGSTIDPVPDGSTNILLEVEVPNVTEGGNHTIILSGTSGNNTEVAITYVFASSHDLVVTGITLSKTVVGQNFPLTINVTIQNQGNFGEVFTVSLYGNQKWIFNQSTYLSARDSTTLTFIWNTSGFVKGNYTISAYAEPVPSETDTSDNRFIDGVVQVTIAGDINGDGWVDGEDLTSMGMAWGSTLGQSNYNSNTDLNNDAWVDGEDLTIMGFNWGQYDP